MVDVSDMVADVVGRALLVAQTQSPSPLEIAGRWMDLIYKFVLTALAIGGAFWDYYKFVKGRTFRRRLTLSVSGEYRRRGRTLHLFATAGPHAATVPFSRP